MHILYATDGSEGAVAAAQLLKLLPLQDHDLRVVTTVGVLEDGEGEHALAPALELLGSASRTITGACRRGQAAEEILQAAAEQPTDLIVVGRRGLGPLGRFLLGSVAGRVARHAACPVLVAQPSKGALDRVVVGVDGSEASGHAADWIRRFPLPGSCVFDLVTVVTPRAQVLTMSRATLSPSLLAEIKSIIQVERRQAQRRLDELASVFAAAGKTAFPKVRPAHPSAGLLSAAEEAAADLIVLGAHGMSALDRFLLGSVSEHVLQHAHFSVLVVRPTPTAPLQKDPGAGASGPARP